MKKILTLLIILLMTPFAYAAGYGGGGGGGGSSSTLEFTSSKNSIDKILQTGNYYTLKLKDKSSYDIFIRNQDENKIILVIATTPLQEITFVLGSQKEIDLNQDGVTDVLFEASQIIQEGKRIQVAIKDNFERNQKKETFQPAKAPEQQLLCGDKPTRRERVKCRLDLDKEKLEYEYELKFLPEECIPLAENKKQKCIQIYKDVQKCWKFSQDESRGSCIKTQLKFKGVSEEIRECTVLKREEKSKCIDDVKENVFTITKFKMYNLEEKAEILLEEGKASPDIVADLITEIEGKKIEFNLAGSIAEKRQIISQVNQLWKEFLKKI